MFSFIPKGHLSSTEIPTFVKWILARVIAIFRKDFRTFHQIELFLEYNAMRFP